MKLREHPYVCMKVGCSIQLSALFGGESEYQEMFATIKEAHR
jgi:hypothetical protein